MNLKKYLQHYWDKDKDMPISSGYVTYRENSSLECTAEAAYVLFLNPAKSYKYQLTILFDTRLTLIQ